MANEVLSNIRALHFQSVCILVTQLGEEIRKMQPTTENLVDVLRTYKVLTGATTREMGSQFNCDGSAIVRWMNGSRKGSPWFIAGMLSHIAQVCSEYAV